MAITQKKNKIKILYDLKQKSVFFPVDPPDFLSPEPEMLDLVVGEEVTLNCSATGYPTPIYSWLSAHTLQETLTDEAIITSSSLLPGTYTCTASNRLDSKSKRFLLKARSKGRRDSRTIKSIFISFFMFIFVYIMFVFCLGV